MEIPMKKAFRSALWFLALVGIAVGQTVVSSVPVSPAQPSAPSYAPSALWLFQTYTRDSYRAAGGGEAPPCDPTLPYKTWFDTSVAPGTTVTYQVFDNTKGALVPLSMTAAQAASLNLPGLPQYPAWTPAPTDAYMQIAGLPQQGVNPELLATEDQANMLAGLLGGTVGQGSLPGTVFPADEQRRQFVILVGGNCWNAGLLLQALYSQGIGYPGKLDPATGQFTATPPPSTSPLGATPIPSRALLPNEAFSNHQFGGDWMVVNTSLQTALGAATAAASSTCDSANLAEILRLVRGVAAVVGVK
jgi:hypothetical protein